MKMSPTPINDKNKIIFIIEDEDETCEEIRCDSQKNDTNDDDDKIKSNYYLLNKEIFKQRYIANLENKRAYQIDYNLINNEKYTEYQRSYYEQRREKLLESKKEKVMCECGKMVSVGHMTCHKKSNCHNKRIQLK
jgi:hypothetical protein